MHAIPSASKLEKERYLDPNVNEFVYLSDVEAPCCLELL